jgi:hypothetical protein
MAKFNFKNVPAFQEDFNGKVEVGTKLFNMGFTGNEINEKLELGFEEKDWRDEWLVSPMLTPASKIIEDDFNSADDQPKQPVSPLSGNDNPSQDQPAELSSEDEGSKNKSVFKTPLQQKYVKAYLKRQDSLENRFERKMSKYFFELRMDLLKRPDAQLASGVVPIDWFKYDLQLQKATVPLIQESILGGVEQAKQATERKGIDEQLIDAQISQYLSIRGNKIQQINRTLQKQIAETIKKAIQAGESITGVALSIQEMSDIVRNELKNYFNNISYRSRLIARTETVGGLNNGSLIYYKEQGFTKKQWLTAGDDEVRVSHIECALQGEIPIDKAFTNGLDYPGDQGSGDAGEVVNCRCTLTAS